MNRYPARVVLLNVIALLLAAGMARPAADLANISASTPLGSIVTAEITLHNPGESPAAFLLYEALESDENSLNLRPAVTPLRVPLPDEAGPISLELRQQFSDNPAASAEIIIYLADQADLGAAAAIQDWNARGAAVVSTLQAHAARTQQPLLDALRAAGQSPRAYWVVNAITLSGDLALAEWLAGQPGVALVASNELHQLEPSEPAAANLAAGEPAWGLRKLDVPGVWGDWGVRGTGIVVANIDTGVAYTHTALLSNYRGWSGGTAGGIANHDYNWFDPSTGGSSPAPFDNNGHGTHTMGTMAGQALGDMPAVGVAPGAQWIAVRGCSGLFCSDEALIASAQWVLAPTNLAGGSPRPDLRPHIVNNSWGKTGSDDWYVGYVEAWNAAGIFSVFAAGNSGAIGACGILASPAGYASAFAVGATNAEDVIAEFSSRGPTAEELTKPDVSAPGVAIASTWRNGGFRSMDGTSMAAPHVAGVAALLWSANPTLIGDIEATRALLTGSAVPLATSECSASTPQVPNNVYGWGRVDARQAVQAALVDVPWLSVPMSVSVPANGQAVVTVTLDARQVSGPGSYQARMLALANNNLESFAISLDVQPAENTTTLKGQLTDLWTAGGVYGRVSIGHGPLLLTSSSGHFTATLPNGSYLLTALANGYFSQTAAIDLPAGSSVNFVLKADLPHLQLAPPPLNATLAFGQTSVTPLTIENTGSQTLTVTTSVPALEWVLVETGVAGAALYDMSATTPLSLTDDMIVAEPFELGFSVPLYGMLVDRLFLSTNGWVSVSRPSSAAPFSSCFPDGSLPPGTLAPFWADLDPSQGGKVRAGHVSSDTFVVSFENVPPWRETPDPAGPTYSFQVALHSDGTVQFLYGSMEGLPPRWSTGAYFSEDRSQRMACHLSPSALSGKQWTMRNQPEPAQWLSASPASLTLAPGSSQTIDVTLAGFGYSHLHAAPYQGVLRLTTNDPAQAIVDLPAQAAIGEAPYRFYLPLAGEGKTGR